jgi:uncharacterized coiled-coil protein SlyX
VNPGGQGAFSQTTFTGQTLAQTERDIRDATRAKESAVQEAASVRQQLQAPGTPPAVRSELETRLQRLEETISQRDEQLAELNARLSAARDEQLRFAQEALAAERRRNDGLEEQGRRQARERDADERSGGIASGGFQGGGVAGGGGQFQAQGQGAAQLAPAGPVSGGAGESRAQLTQPQAQLQNRALLEARGIVNGPGISIITPDRNLNVDNIRRRSGDASVEVPLSNEQFDALSAMTVEAYLPLREQVLNVRGEVIRVEAISADNRRMEIFAMRENGGISFLPVTGTSEGRGIASLTVPEPEPPVPPQRQIRREDLERRMQEAASGQ